MSGPINFQSAEQRLQRQTMQAAGITISAPTNFQSVEQGHNLRADLTMPALASLRPAQQVQALQGAGLAGMTMSAPTYFKSVQGQTMPLAGMNMSPLTNFQSAQQGQNIQFADMNMSPLINFQSAQQVAGMPVSAPTIFESVHRDQAMQFHGMNMPALANFQSAQHRQAMQFDGLNMSAPTSFKSIQHDQIMQFADTTMSAPTNFQSVQSGKALQLAGTTMSGSTNFKSKHHGQTKQAASKGPTTHKAATHYSLLGAAVNVPDKKIIQVLGIRLPITITKAAELCAKMQEEPCRMGKLEPYPLDIMYMILELVDFESILKFRHVCRASFCLVTWMAPRLFGDAALALVSIIRTGVLKNTHFFDIKKALAPGNDKCKLCDVETNAGFNLSAGIRVCRGCLQSDKRSSSRFAMMTLNSFCKGVKMSRARVEREVPVVLGAYDRWFRQSPRDIPLVNFNDAVRILGVDTSGKDFGPGYQGLNPRYKWQWRARDMVMVHLPAEGAHCRDPDLINCKGCALFFEKAREKAWCASDWDKVKVRMISEAVESEPWTVNRRGLDSLRDAAERLYTPSQFLQHVKTCDKAQVLWDASHGGTVSIAQHDTNYLKFDLVLRRR